jgi:hypothetical protein
MSSKPDPAFSTRANALINLANDQCDTSHPNEVGASTLYAAARFNAFLLAKTTGSADNMTLEKERALDYFTDQFRKMMAENLDDFINNFDNYMAPDSH